MPQSDHHLDRPPAIPCPATLRIRRGANPGCRRECRRSIRKLVEARTVSVSEQAHLGVQAPGRDSRPPAAPTVPTRVTSGAVRDDSQRSLDRKQRSKLPTLRDIRLSRSPTTHHGSIYQTET